MQLVFAVFRAIKGRKSFLIFPVISVAVGVFSVVVISTVGAIGRWAVGREIDTLGLNGLMISPAKSETLTYLSGDELEAVRQTKEAMSVSPVVYEMSSIQSASKVTDCLLWGIDGKSNDIMKLDILYGRNISFSDVVCENQVCIIDSQYAESVYGRRNVVGKKVNIMCGTGYESFEVVGITDNSKSLVKGFVSEYVPCFVYLPYFVFFNNIGQVNLNAIAVSVSENIDCRQAEKSIKMALFSESASDAYTVENMSSHRETIESIVNIVTVVLSAIAGISLLISGISVMTVMMFSVGERTHEIGIKKAVGASSADILLEFLSEAVLISLLGTILGLFIAVVACFVLCAASSISASFDLTMIFACIGVTVLLGLVFGIYPAIRASRLDPAEALRRN